MNWDVLVVGAGPAGLAAATRLKEQGLGQVLVIDRERIAGGIPRHCHHTGFGWLDLRRFLSGPAYAQTHCDRATRRNATLWTECTAVGWKNVGNQKVVSTTSPQGIREVSAKAVLLATGCRERPRSARLIPGSRPPQIFTTGSLQRWVHGGHRPPGSTAVVIGAEHVSYSAVLTLREAGVSIAGLVTSLPQTQTYSPAHWWIASRGKTPLFVDSHVTRILGKSRVSGIEITSSDCQRIIHCDCVVFTGDWIPDNEFCREARIKLDPTTKGPDVDEELRTSTDGVFAAGNLLRGAERADIAALEGRHAAESILRFLRYHSEPRDETSGNGHTGTLRIHIQEPILWVTPSLLTPKGENPPRNRLVFRASRFLRQGKIVITQNNQILVSQTFAKLVPNRSYSLKNCAWIKKLTPSGHIEMKFQEYTGETNYPRHE